MKKSSIIFLISLIVMTIVGAVAKTYDMAMLPSLLLVAGGYLIGVSRGITMDEEVLK